MFVVIYVLVLGTSLAWLAASIVLYVLAKREARTLAQRHRHPDWTAWHSGRRARRDVADVATIDTIKGGLGRGPRVRLVLTDGRQAAVPLDQINVFPATLDSTVRAFSAGRHGVDLSALES